MKKTAKKKYSVLVVDDTNLNIMVLTHVLSSEYIVYAARNGRDAIKSAEEHQPDVILLDVVMPDMDGYAVIEELKHSDTTKNIPIIFITGLNKPGDEEKGLASGAADYITKPYSPATIRIRVRSQIKILEQSRANEYSTMKYKLASEAMGIALWDMDVIDTDPVNPKNTFSWSPEFRRLLGFTDEHDFPNVLHSWSDRLHPEDKARSLNAFAAHMNDRTGRTPYDIEYRIKLKNGTYRYFHALGMTLRDNVGTPIRVAGSLKDITEKKQLADRIKYKERMLTALNKMAVIFLSQTKESFDYVMSDAIGPLADVTGLDRVDIYRIVDIKLEKYATQEYRWVQGNRGSAPSPDTLKSIPFSVPVVGGWMKTLSLDGVVNICSDTWLAAEADFLTQLDVKSLLLTPVFKDNELWGCIAFQDNINCRLFDDDTVEVLRSAALLWAGAHIRNEMEHQLDDMLTKLHKERKQFELTSHWHQSLLDAVPHIISATDVDMNWTFINKAAEQLMGVDRDSLLGQPCHLWNLPICKSDACDVARAKRGLKRSYIMYRDLSYQVDVEFLRDLQGDITGYIKVMQDITDTQRLAQERFDAERESLRKSETIKYANKLSNTLTNITKSPTISAGYLREAANFIAREGSRALRVQRVGIWLLTEEGHSLQSITFYDQTADTYSVQEDFDLSHRQGYLNLLHSERLIVATSSEAVNNLFEGDSVYDPNLCAVLDAPIRVDGNLAGVVCIEQDCCEAYPETREWMLEEMNFVASLADLMALAISSAERRESREAAEAASQAKSAFLAMMSHEIRTPMNAIWGITEILMHSGVLSEEVTEGLDRIHNSCGLLLSIINDILDFSKIEAGKMDISPVQYQTASLLNDSIQLNMMRIDSKPIEFSVQVDENLPARLIGDELRIKQVLNNILSNAFKYTQAGKVQLSVRSEPHENGIILVFCVRDTGSGMTDEQLHSLFREYARFNLEHNRAVEGTGLGLAITHRLVHLMDGEITVESELNKGSEFTIRMPQRTVDNDVLGKALAENLQQFRSDYMKHQKRSPVAREPMPYGSVLVVDDMEANIYVAVRLMKPYGLQIETAESGQEAIDKIKAGHVYDVVFMDHMMPGMDGIEATKQLREFGYTHPVVALTANAVAGQADVFLRSGFDSFVSKPIDIRQLNAVLNKLIRDKQPPEVIAAARRQSSTVKAEEDTGQSVPMNDFLLPSVIKDVKKAIATLEDIFENNGIDTEEGLRSYTITVHGIKSSLGNVGEQELSASAGKLEQAGRDKNVEMIISTIQGFMGDLRAFLGKIEQSSPMPAGLDNQDDVVDLQDKLRAIQALCEDYDRRGVLKLLEEFKTCTPETQSVLEKITEHVNHSEFDEASAVATAYVQGLGKR